MIFNISDSEDRAVSPVIGVILMVAITVILAAVIGAFVLGIGPDQDPAPQGTFQISENNDPNSFDVNHRGGDRLDFDDITVVVTGTDDDEIDGSYVLTDDYTTGATDDELTAGSSADVTFEDSAIGSDGAGAGTPETSTIRLVHQPSDSILLDRTVEIDFQDSTP